MYSMHHASHKPLFLLVSLAALLTSVLAACGSTGGPGAGTGSTSTPTSTSGPGYGTAHGCPSDAVVTPAPPAANVEQACPGLAIRTRYSGYTGLS